MDMTEFNDRVRRKRWMLSRRRIPGLPVSSDDTTQSNKAPEVPVTVSTSGRCRARSGDAAIAIDFERQR